MNRRALAAAAGLALFAACGSDDDGAGDGEGLEFADLWARATAEGTSVGAIYVELTSPVDDTLTGVTVDPSIAASTMLHMTTETSDGMTTMDHVDGIELPAGEAVALAPNGMHVMLDDLAAPLEVGTTFDATFEFASAADLTISVDVRADAP